MSGIATLTEIDFDQFEDRRPSPQAAEDQAAHQLLDEGWSQVERRKAADAKLRAKLSQSKSSRAVYLEIALEHQGVTHAEFRVLTFLASKGDPALRSAFPSQEQSAARLGMKQPTYNTHLVALRRKGWIKTHEFSDGGRQGNSGVQFMIPAGLLPLGEAWCGPVDFQKHWGRPKPPRNSRRKGGRPRQNPAPAVVTLANYSPTIRELQPDDS